MTYYSIAGLNIESFSLPSCFSPFEIPAAGQTHCTIIKDSDGFSNHSAPRKSFPYDSFIITALEDNSWLYTSPEKFLSVSLLVSPDYSQIRVHFPPGDVHDHQDWQLSNLLRVALECLLIRHGRLSLHSACVALDGHAVAFTGHSTVGKSTRAGKWVDHLGAQWLSGDRPTIACGATGLTACGVPWDGKEQVFSPMMVPLKAIVEVRRAGFVGARRLNAAQARALLMQQCFLPMWDTETAAMAMFLIGSVIRQGVVLRGFCGPDEESAAALREILYRNPHAIGEEKVDMRIKKDFKLQKMMDEFMVLPTGDNINTFNGAVVLNEVSAFIFEQLEKGVSREDLLNLLLGEYDYDTEDLTEANEHLTMALEAFNEIGVLDAEGEAL